MGDATVKASPKRDFEIAAVMKNSEIQKILGTL